MSAPANPNDIAGLKRSVFPPAVFEAVNELIAEKFTNGRANFTQDEVVARIAAKMPGEDYEIKSGEIYKRGWLNFEEVYRDEGWSVEYDKPAYNESYSANFTFRKKR